MYKIIGADQREYGPVPVEQVRKWIAEGRANAQTKAWSEGSSDWKTLAGFPEFADLLMAKGAVAQLPPPKIGALDADKLAAEIIARDYRVDIGDCFSRSWNLVRDNFWLLLGATAVALVIGTALGFVPVLGITAAVFLALVFQDRKSTRLNSSHVRISYAVFCLKKKSTRAPCHPPRTTGARVRGGRCRPPRARARTSYRR